MIIASVEIPDLVLVFTIDGKKEIIKLSKDEFFKKYCVSDSDNTLTDFIDIEIKDNIEKFNLKFCYSLDGPIAPRIISSINLLPVEGGGSHVNYFYDLIREFFTLKAKKSNIKFQPNDCLSGLRLYLSLELEKPEYASQSKDKLINKKEEFVKYSNKIKLELEKYFNKNQESLNEILSFFEEYRKKIESKKIKTVNTGSKRASTKFTKLRDCSGNNGELYVVEGDSAGGGFIECRDARKHAILPLRGKIPSIINKDDILKNKEINELISALGTGVGPNFDITKLKYDKIICSTDADADGGHIFCLMCLALAILVPDIIKNGHFYLLKTPLYAINKPKVFIPLWTTDELFEAKKKNETIIRCKGLGELSAWQLKMACINEDTRNLIKVEYTNDPEKIIKLFSDVNAKRELLNGEN